MRILLAFIVMISFGATGQTGNLKTNVTFVYDNGCSTIKLELISDSLHLHYDRIKKYDTIFNIPAGTYSAKFLACDSSIYYGQTIEIVENETSVFYYRNNASTYTAKENYYSGYDFETDEYYYDSSYYGYNGTFFIINGWQYGQGLDYDNKNHLLENNYSIQYSLGQDFLIKESPFALGYEAGFSYHQYNYNKMDFQDSSIIYDKQQFRSVNLTFSVLSSIYIARKKFMDVGLKYSLPLYARMERFAGDNKFTTRRIHNHNDLTAFAQIGYWWGFIYAEYQLFDILKEPWENAPMLTVGLRFNAPVEW